MNTLRHYLSSKSLNSSSSAASLSALNEPEVLKDAMLAAGMILDDDVDGAETELSKGSTPYHKLGKGVVSFLRSVLGFEQEMMNESSKLLAEAESAASDAQRRSYKEGYKSAIYPPGSEYALCYAEAQLMAAVIGVLNESLTEAVKGFYRLRRAYATLQEIADAENKFIKNQSEGALSGHSRDPSTTNSSIASTLAPTSGNTTPLRSGQVSPLPASKDIKANSLEDEDDDLDFVDADDSVDGHTLTDGYSGHLLSPMSDLSMDVPEPKDTDRLPASALSNPIDLFIHTGTSLCFGILQLLLSLVPPTFSRLLSIVGFRGSRTVGLKMLWNAAEHTDHINGGIAALVLMGFYNNMVGFCDIISPDERHDRKCRDLLAQMRQRYPNGKFWLLEEARVLAMDRKPEQAIELMMGESKVSPLKQIEALRWFESSLNWLYIGEWEKCAQGFLKCCDLNNWSQALYYYIAATCYIELYRAATDAAQKEKFKSRAEELLATVSTKTGKRRFMARQLPFDAFVGRKHAKWTAAAEKRGCSIVDAAGVSPAEEMVYFWNGSKRRNAKHLEAGLARVEWFKVGDGVAGKEHDEVVAYYVLKGTLLQRLGRGEEARALLADNVASEELTTYKSKVGGHAETWPLPVGCYELAVCAWEDYLTLVNGGGDELVKEEKLHECRGWVDKVAKWEGYDLDARMGMKVKTAQETLRKLKSGT
ncbi:hypothetical protein K461DRAFT_277847 [Myriangium duriaei CBS 260.36]|uniref:Inclusion body clearance protein IML2 n=1 Tax=Myriangium duriaei CBS 260.36 TaxID=1168546 RepID=A0A9P4J641_9PEZI|nr:hypothetical protein K461DRAFT_277847 [Myriangium duriaei CBS 260.36]